MEFTVKSSAIIPEDVYKIILSRAARKETTLESEIVYLITRGLDAERRDRPDHIKKDKRIWPPIHG